MAMTKEYLKSKVEQFPVSYIGRALVILFNRQTMAERANNATKLRNGVGFAACDGRIGALGAKYYLKHGTLLEWQLKPWIKPVNGYPRICKYLKQLNEHAAIKQQNKDNVHSKETSERILEE